MTSIKPKFPTRFIEVGLIIFSLGLLQFFVDDINMIITIGSYIFIIFGLSIFWIIDYSHMSISSSSKYLNLKGYFSIRNIEIPFSEVKGYEIQEKLDEWNGHHDEVQLVLFNGEKIVIPRIAYSNYQEVTNILKECDFEFLGYNPIKYGAIVKKIMPVVFLLSGILAAIVGILKLF